MVEIGDKGIIFGYGSPYAQFVPVSTPNVGDRVILIPLDDGRTMAVPMLQFNIADMVWIGPEWRFAGFNWKMDFNFNLIPLSVAMSLNWSTILTGVTRVCIHGDIFAAYLNATGKIWLSDSAGTSWSETGVKPPGIGTLVKFMGDGMDLYTLDNNKLYKSSNGGVSWSTVADRSAAPFNVPFIPYYFFDFNIFDGYLQVSAIVQTSSAPTGFIVWESANGGASWTWKASCTTENGPCGLLDRDHVVGTGSAFVFCEYDGTTTYHILYRRATFGGPDQCAAVAPTGSSTCLSISPHDNTYRVYILSLSPSGWSEVAQVVTGVNSTHYGQSVWEGTAKLLDGSYLMGLTYYYHAPLGSTLLRSKDEGATWEPITEIPDITALITQVITKDKVVLIVTSTGNLWVN